MSREFFKWDEDFNTGNDKIDLQHFNLVDMINELLELSIKSKTIELKTIEDIGNKLSNYVVEHFSTEEKLMEIHSVDYRHTDDHIKSHEDFINEVKLQFDNPEKLQNPSEINDIVEYLIRWLAYHILNTDKSLVRQINYITDEGMTPSQAFEIEEQLTESSTEPLLKALKVLYLLVSKKNREIEIKNVELEEKVKLRTAELLKANEKLNEMLLQDLLTGLPNRRFVMEEIQKLINNWERYHIPFSILFIDVDKFKKVNDSYGHENGDNVLKWVAEFLKSSIRKTDIACRLGGDEFVIICPNTDEESAHSIGIKLNNICNEKCEHIFDLWKPSLSIGVSTVNEHLISPSELLKKADSAMYISKSHGGNSTFSAD